MNAKNYQDLRNKASRLAMEIASIESRVSDPSNFAAKGEMPYSSHIGWATKTAWFYTEEKMKKELEGRQAAAVAKLALLKEKRARVLKKATQLFNALPWAERAILVMVGADPKEG